MRCLAGHGLLWRRVTPTRKNARCTMRADRDALACLRPLRLSNQHSSNALLRFLLVHVGVRPPFLQYLSHHHYRDHVPITPSAFPNGCTRPRTPANGPGWSHVVTRTYAKETPVPEVTSHKILRTSVQCLMWLLFHDTISAMAKTGACSPLDRYLCWQVLVIDDDNMLEVKRQPI